MELQLVENGSEFLLNSQAEEFQKQKHGDSGQLCDQLSSALKKFLPHRLRSFGGHLELTPGGSPSSANSTHFQLVRILLPEAVKVLFPLNPFKAGAGLHRR